MAARFGKSRPVKAGNGCGVSLVQSEDGVLEVGTGQVRHEFTVLGSVLVHICSTPKSDFFVLTIHEE